MIENVREKIKMSTVRRAAVPFDNCANALINDQSCGPEVVWLVVNDRVSLGLNMRWVSGDEGVRLHVFSDLLFILEHCKRARGRHWGPAAATSDSCHSLW